MPCSPRTTDGRCQAEKVVYQLRDKRVEIPVGKPADVRLKGKEISEKFQSVPKENLPDFPEGIHLKMSKNRITVSDTSRNKEVTRFEFIIDEKGLKMAKQYDELGIWMALYGGLTKGEININTFYQMLARTGFFKT